MTTALLTNSGVAWIAMLDPGNAAPWLQVHTSHRAAVLALQQRLDEHAIPVTITGIFDDDTVYLDDIDDDDGHTRFTLSITPHTHH